MPDGVEQVGFSESDAAVDIERVVLVAGMLGDGLGRGMGKDVRFADDIGFEQIARIQIVGRRWQRCGRREGELLIVARLGASVPGGAARTVRRSALGGAIGKLRNGRRKGGEVGGHVFGVGVTLHGELDLNRTADDVGQNALDLIGIA